MVARYGRSSEAERHRATTSKRGEAVPSGTDPERRTRPLDRVRGLIREATVLGVLLTGLVLPASAAAAGGVSPDPAPSTGGATASSPAPDPVPQAARASVPSSSSSAHTSPTQTSSSSSAHTQVPPAPPAQPSGPNTSNESPAPATAGTASAAVVVPVSERPSSSGDARPARHAKHAAQLRKPVAAAHGDLLAGVFLAERRLLGGASAVVTPITTAVSRHNGLWPLLSAMALVVLVIASLSLLRQLRSEWEGP